MCEQSWVQSLNIGSCLCRRALDTLSQFDGLLAEGGRSVEQVRLECGCIR